MKTLRGKTLSGAPGAADSGAAGATDPGALDDAELLVRIQARDREAYEILFHRYQRRVFAFVQRRLRDPGLAEETVIDTFFEVWRNAASFRGQSQPSSWIFGVAHFKAMAAHRHRARPKRSAVLPVASEQLERAPDGRDPAEQLEARDEMRRLQQVVRSLGDMPRRVAELVWFEGLSHEEAAERLGVSTDSVKTRLWRARQRVRQELRPLGTATEDGA